MVGVGLRGRGVFNVVFLKKIIILLVLKVDLRLLTLSYTNRLTLHFLKKEVLQKCRVKKINHEIHWHWPT